MKQAGFQGVFCNVGDFGAEAWDVVRSRARQQGMFCGPWERMGQGPGTFDTAKLNHLIGVADQWDSPLIVNAEAELNGSGIALTTLIASMTKGKDAAISMEPWLFPNVEWTPVRDMPMLLQINPAENQASKDPNGCKGHAHQLGVKCVYFTFGTAPPQEPGLYNLQSPYSLYTGDNATPFNAWSPTSSGFKACLDPPNPEPPMSLTPTQKKNFRAELVSFLTLAERYNNRWHYTQRRPYTGIGVAPQSYHYNDCSSYVALAYYWATRHNPTPARVSDPLGYNYSGYGNTQSALQFLRGHAAPAGKYLVGDMALYGDWGRTVHITVCRKAGNEATAVWSSFGREAGPEPRSPVTYHPAPLLAVYRHPALQ